MKWGEQVQIAVNVEDRISVSPYSSLYIRSDQVGWFILRLCHPSEVALIRGRRRAESVNSS